MGQSDKQLCTIPLYIHPRHCFAQQLPVRRLSYNGPLTKLGKADSLFLLDLVCAGGKHVGSSGSTGADLILFRVCGGNMAMISVFARWSLSIWTSTQICLATWQVRLII